MGAASRPPPGCCSSHAKYPWLPMFKRAAIQANGIVVLGRNSRARLCREMSLCNPEL